MTMLVIAIFAGAAATSLYAILTPLFPVVGVLFPKKGF